MPPICLSASRSLSFEMVMKPYVEVMPSSEKP